MHGMIGVAYYEWQGFQRATAVNSSVSSPFVKTQPKVSSREFTLPLTVTRFTCVVGSLERQYIADSLLSEDTLVFN